MLRRIWQNLRIVDQIQKTKRALASRDPLPIKHRETGSNCPLWCSKHIVTRRSEEASEVRAILLRIAEAACKTRQVRHRQTCHSCAAQHWLKRAQNNNSLQLRNYLETRDAFNRARYQCQSHPKGGSAGYAAQ